MPGDQRSFEGGLGGSPVSRLVSSWATLLVTALASACGDGAPRQTVTDATGGDPAADSGSGDDAVETDAPADAVETDAPADALSGGDPATDPGAPPGSERYILDDSGAVLLLRGVNVESAAKGRPSRLPTLEPADLDRLSRWGFNFVRFLIFWDAIEPSAGTYDLEYLAEVRARLDLLHARGIRVMLDMHQDVYSSRFCCDGAPEWAIRDDGMPFVLQSSWFANYYQPAVQRAFDNFWDAEGPHGDLQEHYAGAWSAVVGALGDHPAVIGYDLMNEPFPGTAFNVTEALVRRSEPDGGTSRRFDEDALAPFYQRLVDTIRSDDLDAWIFFESRYGAPANGSPCWLPPLTDPRPGGPRLVYAPHLYSVALEASGAYSAADATLESWQEARLADAERLGAPILTGEWGLAYGARGADRFFREVVAMSNDLFVGWAYWSYDPSGSDGWGLWDAATGEDNPAAALVVQPFPSRTPGAPVTLEIDPAGAMHYVFDHDPTIGGALEIAVPGDSAQAPSWSTDPGGAATESGWDAARRTLSLRVVAPGRVSVTVQR